MVSLAKTLVGLVPNQNGFHPNVDSEAIVGKGSWPSTSNLLAATPSFDKEGSSIVLLQQVLHQLTGTDHASRR
jgi:hypothetical protein